MLRIRKASWEALERHQEKILEDAAIDHVRSRFPRVAAAMEPDVLRSSVRAVIDRAREHGLASGRDLLLFLNLCVAYGWDFAERPEQGWIRATLRDPTITSPSARLDALRGELRRARERART